MVLYVVDIFKLHSAILLKYDFLKEIQMLFVLQLMLFHSL